MSTYTIPTSFFRFTYATIPLSIKTSMYAQCKTPDRVRIEKLLATQQPLDQYDSAELDYLLQNVEPDGIGGVALPAESVSIHDAREE